MLTHLHIEQFVIIDQFDMDLEAGLTVITGETGAGKTILLDALHILFGAPSSPESVRQGADRALIEARFSPPLASAVWPLLVESKLVPSAQGEFTIRRAIHRDGREERTLNGQNVDRALLSSIGQLLGEIHGQGANHSMMDPANQLHLLDLSGNFPPEIMKNVADALDAVQRAQKELEEEKLFIARHGHELKQVEDIVKRFDEIEMKPGLLATARDEHARLLTAKETSDAFQTVLAQLIAGSGAIKSLSSANQIIQRQKNMDREKTAKLSNLLETSLEKARDAVDEMHRLSPDYDIDTQPLQRYEEILNSLQKIASDNKIKPEELDGFYQEMDFKLKRIRGGRAAIQRMEDTVLRANTTYRQHAKILSEKRKEAARKLSASITAELAPLKLMRAEFEVRVEERPDDPWTKLGLDQVTFTARMNPGTPFSPIAETASGGELARIILAMKVVLQTVLLIPTLVFDEVDVGIGGAAASAVGERIAILADTTQVLIITHSPQVASRGDRHLYISKKTDGVTTTSVARLLTMDERIDEISRMLAGEATTTESHAAAKSLIDEAASAVKLRRPVVAAHEIA